MPLLERSLLIFFSASDSRQHYVEERFYSPKISQAPKSSPLATKQALILTWIQKSGVAHSIKDLEKALPSVASVNGMQVKDYIQALSDDNKVRVEKIGSGNWYWSFPSEEKSAKDITFSKARDENEKAVSMVAELQEKFAEAGTARKDDEDMLLGPGNDRKSLTTKHTALLKELEVLRQELARYNEDDPVEVDKKRLETKQYKWDAEKRTEHIQSIEGWLKEQTGGDKDQMMNIMKTYYGDQFNEEDECLREL
ncbi:meiotic nuclear division protein 1 [Glonium stellatum]|uniref:Meiotic nuclear division protein 1 n=1 Tax=Glonium stellatum TaxID=574774 RepID=A0A8E2EWJ7_9PEZI|nr:meiotic nuclear division protein 1 [Glonium stellatum]